MPMDDSEGEARPEALAAWLAGRKAGLGRVGADANPHPPDNDLGLDWEDGWRQGAHVRNILPTEEWAKAWARLQ